MVALLRSSGIKFLCATCRTCPTCIASGASGTGTGKLDKWDFAGSGGGTFVEGAPEKKALPVVEEYNGKVGLKVGLLQSLQSSFKSPESINGGPFTVVTHFAREVESQRLPLVTWDSKSLRLPEGGIYPSGTIFHGQRIHPNRPDRLAGFGMKHPKL